MSLEQTTELYASVLRQLLPEGVYDTAEMTHVADDIYAHAKALAQADIDAHRLLQVLEKIPVDLLADYEREYGLPMQCMVPGSQTIEERISVLRWIRQHRNVMNREYLEQILAIFGVTLVDVVKHRPMLCTAPCASPVNTERLRYKVLLRLQYPMTADMSCIIENYLPGYISVSFSTVDSQPKDITAPYDVQYTVDNNSIRWTFKNDSEPGSYRYYISESPINLNNLPNAKDENILTKMHVDHNFEFGVRHFVRFSAVNQWMEKFSEETIIYEAEPFIGSNYLITSFKKTVWDWSTAANDYSANVNADASWENTDYVVFSIHSRTLISTAPNGFTLLYSNTHTSIPNSYLYVYGGLKGNATTFNFNFQQSIDGSCFAIAAIAMSNIEGFSDVVYSEQTGRDFNGNIRIGESSGLVAISTIGFSNASGAFNFSPATPSMKATVASNAVGYKGCMLYAHQVHDFLNKSKAFDFKSTLDCSISNATLFFKRKIGLRPSLIYNKAPLQDVLQQAKGYAYAILKDGNVVETMCGGIDKDGGEPITENTIFPLASVSKLITELAIRKLAQDGVLHLDNTIGQYFTYLPLGLNVATISIRQLLAMKAGIAAEFNLLNANYIDETNNWLLNTSINQGISYQYNNGCFAVLTRIIDLLTGGYVAYVQGQILNKLDIHDATHDSSTLQMKMHDLSFNSASIFNVYSTGVGGWCMSLNSLAKIAKAIRYPIFLNQQKSFFEDRYRMVQLESTRGEFFQHDGLLLDYANRGIRSQLVIGADGYDIVCFTNTNTTSLLAASRLVLS